jgi:hypothetical protein
MIRSIAWLLGKLGPPPPPPRRYFSRSWAQRAPYRAGQFPAVRPLHGARAPAGVAEHGTTGAGTSAAADDRSGETTTMEGGQRAQIMPAVGGQRQSAQQLDPGRDQVPR